MYYDNKMNNEDYRGYDELNKISKFSNIVLLYYRITIKAIPEYRKKQPIRISKKRRIFRIRFTRNMAE